MLVGLLCSFAVLRAPPALTRRQAVGSAVAGLLPLALLPTQARAGLFSDDGPAADLGSLVKAQIDLTTLEAQLSSGALKDTEEDSVVVLRTVTLQQGGTGELMKKVLASSSKLDASQRTRAAEAAAAFGKQVTSLKDAARRREGGAQKSAAAAAAAAIGDYLGVLSSSYEVPAFTPAKAYSSDPTTFTAQYFGFFSCEGQGLARLPGSNSCGDRLKQ